MFGLRLNLAVSVLMHVTFILSVAGVHLREMAHNAPARHMTVKLFQELSEVESFQKKDETVIPVKNAFPVHKENAPLPGKKDRKIEGPAPRRLLPVKESPYTTPDMGVPATATNSAGSIIFTQEESDTENGPVKAASPIAGSETVRGKTGLISSGGEKNAYNYSPLIRSSIEKAKRYPVQARRRGIEGTVRVSFSIGRNGFPRDIKIVESSGFSILDAEAAETVVRASPLPSIEGLVEIPITFRLDRN